MNSLSIARAPQISHQAISATGADDYSVLERPVLAEENHFVSQFSKVTCVTLLGERPQTREFLPWLRKQATEGTKKYAPFILALALIYIGLFYVHVNFIVGDRFGDVAVWSTSFLAPPVVLFLISILCLLIVGSGRNRVLPITFSFKIVSYIFLFFMLIIGFNRGFYAFNMSTWAFFQLTAASYVISGVVSALMALEVAKFKGEKIGVFTLDSDPDDGRDRPIAADGKETQFSVLVTKHHHYAEPAAAAYLTQAHIMGKEIIDLAKFYECRTGRASLPEFDLGGFSHSWNQKIYIKLKRLIDLGLCVVFGPLIIILSGLIALYILAISGRPVLFRQTRIGYGGVPFEILKFRTMKPSPVHLADITTMVGDSRVIRGGGVLRRFRLDELPQFLHILSGRMSLIGPRPEWSVLVEKYAPDISEYNYRHLAVPGITGWAQVKMGYAGDIEDTKRKISYDIYYIKNISLELDLRILIKTIRTLIWGRGVR